MPRPSPHYLAVVLVLSASPALGQQGQPGGELGGAPPPEEQERLKVCPELKDATGRRREQLEALFFGLSPRDVEAKPEKIQALFPLEGEDVKLLEAELDGAGPARCLPGLQTVVRAHGARGVLWLLERLAAQPAARRGRTISVLAALDAREAWQALVALLADATPVPNPKGAAQAPPGYVEMRVCDHALRALSQRLKKFKRPEGIEWRADPMLPIAVRDKRVAAARALAKDELFQADVASKPAARDELKEPALQRRLDAALAALSTS